MWHYGITQRRCEDNLNSFSCHLRCVVHPTWPSQAMWRMHAPTFNKWHKKEKKKTLHMLTHGVMRRCGLTSLVVCNDDWIRDKHERLVTIRSEIWTLNIRSLGFQDIRECVTLQELILWSLECIYDEHSWGNILLNMSHQYPIKYDS